MINTEDRDAIVAGRHADPFSVLGFHRDPNGQAHVLAWLPGACAVHFVLPDGGAPRAFESLHDAGLFGLDLPEVKGTPDYKLRVEWPGANSSDSSARVVQLMEDPYRFEPLLSTDDLWLFCEGKHERPYQFLGAHCVRVADVPGVRFSVWAPNASSVAVVGDFNAWNETRHPMRLRVEAGIWEIFIAGIGAGECYKFALRNQAGDRLPWHADPFARQAELRPATASVVSELPIRGKSDVAWVNAGQPPANRHEPISIYEVHAGSWRRSVGEGGPFLSWDELGEQLVSYASDMGFTHIELLPISEHPFDGSWGYQPTGMYAPTARFGDPAGLRRFVSSCHDAGIGVILDWVPGHFPSDAHAQAQYDGSHLFEHADPLEGFHPDWNTLIYNFGRREVHNFLVGNARYWVEEFDIDGLRVDAVASMLYRDYSRTGDQWVPNRDGGRENYEAIELLRQMNESLGRTHPHVITLAEESTAWPGVSQPTSVGGLGFHYKWNLGWMNDSLRFMGRDPVHRGFHLNDMTFGLLYAFTENFVLPLSHDEFVHGKGSLLGRMPGDRWQQFANLRMYLVFMYAHPGKKLLFMGCEIAQPNEWNHDTSIDWHLLGDSAHSGVQSLVRDLNQLLRTTPALYQRDAEQEGFDWLVADDQANTVLAFIRNGYDNEPPVLVVCNFTPTVREDYRVGVPRSGSWVERINSDALVYGGSDTGNLGQVDSQPQAMHGHADSVSLTLPPLATIVLQWRA